MLGTSVTLCQEKRAGMREDGAVDGLQQCSVRIDDLLRRAAPLSVFHGRAMSANDHHLAAGALARLCEHVDGCRTRTLVDEGFERVEREAP